jgi:hypothetical protein
MKIYRLAQISSLMYYLNDIGNSAILTPDPSKAEYINDGKDSFPVFILRPGKYYNPDQMYAHFSEAQIQMLKNKGYVGIINGEDIIILDKSYLNPVGEYDMMQHRVVK